jgi:hypothetical protein
VIEAVARLVDHAATRAIFPDHGRTGRRGRSGALSRPWDAVIKNQFMIMEHDAGDCLAAAQAGRAGCARGRDRPGRTVRAGPGLPG